MSRSVVVVCVGNICRSPMAEAILQAARPDYRVNSAGIGALVDYPAHPRSIDLMAARGLDLSHHVARQLSKDIVNHNDLIITMEKAHTDWIARQWPQVSDRVFRWGHWQDFDVPDPYRRDDKAFQQALELIDLGLDQWLEQFRLMDQPDSESPLLGQQPT